MPPLNVDARLAMHQSRVQKALHVALVASCMATLVHCMTGVGWSSVSSLKSAIGAVAAYSTVSSLGLTPYLLLGHLLRRTARNGFKSIAFALVVAPAPTLFVAWRNVEDGWSFLLVPAVQSLIAMTLIFLAALVRRHGRATT
jgi:hypothetical protein